MISNTERKLTYPISLLLSIDKKKTCELLAKQIKKSGDTVIRLLNSPLIKMEDLISTSKDLFKDKRIFLIVDDTLLEKRFSYLIEGASDNYDTSNGTHYRSLCSVVAVLTDGKLALPVTHALWSSQEFDPVNNRKKWELAQELTLKINGLIDIDMVLADGLYATQAMLRWLVDKKIFFEMRFHSNRVIEINNIRVAIRDARMLNVNTSRQRRTITASWKGMNLYFTAIRRWTRKSGSIVIYQVSNRKASPRNHERFYSYRWNIEMFFRTAKQHLGLNDCQVRNKGAQFNHIMNVFCAYAILQNERKTKQLPNPETALRRFKSKNYQQLAVYLASTGQIFGGVYV